MTTERKVKMLSTRSEVTADNHGTGVELYYCSISGEPVICRVKMSSERKRAVECQNCPDEPYTCIFVGKGAHRAALGLKRKEEQRLGVLPSWTAFYGSRK